MIAALAGAFHFPPSEIDSMDAEDLRFWADRLGDWAKIQKGD